MTNLLLSLIVFGVNCWDWFIAGRKGLAMLLRSPWFIFWAMSECAAAVFFVRVIGRGSDEDAVVMGVAAVLGCGLGSAVSGVVEWSKQWTKFRTWLGR